MPAHGDVNARCQRCELTLRIGESSRRRRALHQLYDELHRPSADDLALIERLEATVVGELSVVLDRSFEVMREDLRSAWPRFDADMPSSPPTPARIIGAGSEEIRFHLTEEAAISGSHLSDVALVRRAAPGAWTWIDCDPRNIDEPGKTIGIGVHAGLRIDVDGLLSRATVMGTVDADGGRFAICDAAYVEDAAVQEEFYDPIDETLDGHGIRGTAYGNACPVLGVEDAGRLVLIAIESMKR